MGLRVSVRYDRYSLDFVNFLTNREYEYIGPFLVDLVFRFAPPSLVCGFFEDWYAADE